MADDGKYHIEITKLDGTPVPADEVFILRFKDDAAIEALGTYWRAAARLGASSEFLADLTRTVVRATQWRVDHRDECKVPD